jgi:hypothetical protein
VVESQIVDLVVAGSNPVIHPKGLKQGVNLTTNSMVTASGKFGV